MLLPLWSVMIWGMMNTVVFAKVEGSSCGPPPWVYMIIAVLFAMIRLVVWWVIMAVVFMILRKFGKILCVNKRKHTYLKRGFLIQYLIFGIIACVVLPLGLEGLIEEPFFLNTVFFVFYLTPISSILMAIALCMNRFVQIREEV